MSRTKAETGYANGGLGSHGAIAEVDDSKNNSRNLVGIGAFAMVETHQAGGGALAELAWFYCASAFELGMTSSFDAMERQLKEGASEPCAHCGRPFFAHAIDVDARDPHEPHARFRCRLLQERFQKPGEPIERDERGYPLPQPETMHVKTSHTCTEPSGPGPQAMNAAKHQRRILGLLARVPAKLRTVLEVAYSDRRCPQQLVHRYGLGVCLLVWRATWAAGDRDPGPKTLAALLGQVQEFWPTWEPRKRDLTDKIAEAADLLLWTAHLTYGAHWLAMPARRRKARKERKRPVWKQAGRRGRSKRQLIMAAAA